MSVTYFGYLVRLAERTCAPEFNPDFYILPYKPEERGLGYLLLLRPGFHWQIFAMIRCNNLAAYLAKQLSFTLLERPPTKVLGIGIPLASKSSQSEVTSVTDDDYPGRSPIHLRISSIESPPLLRMEDAS